MQHAGCRAAGGHEPSNSRGVKHLASATAAPPTRKWAVLQAPCPAPHCDGLLQVKLSSSCNDLLKKLLGRDKLTVVEIMKQPWFLVDFPKGLKEMNSYCLKMKACPLHSMLGSTVFAPTFDVFWFVPARRLDNGRLCYPT